eukprot:1394102-Amorphochlora_amoeboformis.AAC.1
MVRLLQLVCCLVLLDCEFGGEQLSHLSSRDSVVFGLLVAGVAWLLACWGVLTLVGLSKTVQKRRSAPETEAPFCPWEGAAKT